MQASEDIPTADDSGAPVAPTDGGAKAAGDKKVLKNGLDPAIGKKTQIKPGEVRNPEGKTGISLKTIAKRVLEEELDWEKVPVKNNKEMQAKYGKRGWEAIVHVATAKAVSGDIQAMKWLSEVLYGKQLAIDHTTKNQPIPLLAGLAPAVLEVDDDAAQADDGAHEDQPA